MLYISNTLLCIPISILIKAMQTKQNASGEGKYVQICALSSDMKKKNPESVSDIIRNHLGDFFCCCFFSYGKQQKKLTIGMYKSRIAAECCRADKSSNRCGLRHATNIGVG